jgi:Ca-activated chloride channel family protein
MWVDGKEVSGELVEADKARTIYTDIVRRTQDPGLLEYIGSNLLRLRVFPVPAHGDQKLSVCYTSIAASDDDLVEYAYPLRADARAVQTMEQFTLEATLKAQSPLQSIYSPSHNITVTRPNDHQAVVRFTSKQVVLDKDFQLYYSTGARDVGVTALLHRPHHDADGHFMLLISPRAELSQQQRIPRDVVLVLDTSGSMQGRRIQQARNALKYCLRNLDSHDRFALISFATTVNKHTEGLVPANKHHLGRAREAVDRLDAVGGTNISEALATALGMRTADSGRAFTVVFFTDGQPTIGETNPDQIVKDVVARNTANTRIFTFGVGDDVNAVLLDQLAEKTRAVSTYVRETEDIEAKVSTLYSKISHPVLTNLKLSVGSKVTVSEVYPPQLPDLFHGGQLVVLGRYKGHGHAAVKLTGKVGDETKEFTYEVNFPSKTKGEKAFVEDLWARRKVGYLLDQIRINGENKEVVSEVVALAKKYGITTPYTSYLVVPDYTPVANATLSSTVPQPRMTAPQYPTSQQDPAVMDSGRVRMALPTPARAPTAVPGGAMGGRIQYAPVTPCVSGSTAAAPAPPVASYAMQSSGKEGVDLSLQLNELRTQSQVAQSVVRQAAGRNCRQINAVWLDEGFDPKMPVVKIKAQSKAYFRILEKQPQMREVFQLGNHVVWVTPSGSALIIQPDSGQESMTDAEIDWLFVARK